MTGPFSRPTLAIVIGVAAASLVVAAVLTLFGDSLGAPPSAGVDGYSVSAIGHRGLVRLLERLDIPVVVSRSDSAARAAHSLLIIAEPNASDDDARAQLSRLVERGHRVLVVLPKWFGSAERGQPWLADAHLLPLDEVQRTLDAIGLTHTAVVVRPRFPYPLRVKAPPVIRVAQRVTSADLTAIVDDETGAQLVGTHDAVTVLADPDPLSNFGLREPANARFAVGLIDHLRDGGPVVLDETLHGYARQPSLARTLFTFPLVIATVQVVICGLLVVWAAMVRFGPRRAAPPPIAPGKDFLIRNTAALLHYGGHHGHALQRYLQLTVAAVRHALHAPSLAPDAMTAWLERVRLARGGTIPLTQLERDVEAAGDPARVVELADLVYRWRMEMTHGTDRRP